MGKDNEDSLGSKLLSNAGGIIGGVTSALRLFGVGEKRQDRRQIDQQGKLNDVNAKTAKELADYENAGKLKMWKDTNYTAQLAEATKAGVSKAAAIGGSGTGTQGASVSGVGGGSAADAASTMQANTGAAAQAIQSAAQLNLMKAQADNLNADTKDKLANIPNKGTQNELGQEDLTTKKFNNSILKTLGVAEQSEAVRNANRKLEAESGKAWNEYEAWKAAGFGEMENNDPNSPVAKAIKAGFDKTITEASNAKKEGRIKDATATIEGFKANLAKQGISPDSPWYWKLLSDVASKLDINPLDWIKK